MKHVGLALSWVTRVVVLTIVVGGVTWVVGSASTGLLPALFTFVGGIVVACGAAVSLFNHVERLVESAS